MSATFIAAFQGGQSTSVATTATFASQTSGKSMLAVVAWPPASADPTSVTTSGGDTLTQTAAGVQSTPDGNFNYATYFIAATTATATGITATFPSFDPAYSDISGWIFTGLTSPVIDVYVPGSGGTGTAATNSSGTLASSDEFVGAVCWTGDAVSAGAGTGFTFDGIATGTGTGYSHAIATTTASLTPTFTIASSATWMVLIVSVKGSGGSTQALASKATLSTRGHASPTVKAALSAKTIMPFKLKGTETGHTSLTAKTLTAVKALAGLSTAAPGSAVTIDATATASSHVSSANTISLTTLTVGTGNGLLVFADFGYSNHTGFTASWDTAGTDQALSFITTSDNGGSAPAIAVMGLLNPTAGNKTLTITWTGAADNVVLYAVSLNNVDTRSLSRAFTAAAFLTGTSNTASMTLPPVPGGLQFVNASGLTGSGAPSGWAAGPTSLYVDSSVGTWGAGAWQAATAAHTFTQNIASSEFWAMAGVVANPPANLPSGTLAINSGNSIASGLTAAIPCLGNVTLTDLVSAKTATPSGCTTDTSGGYGGGLAVPGGSTTAKADFGVFQPISNGDYTLLAFCNPPSSSTRGIAVGQCDSGGAGFVALQTNSVFATTGGNGIMASEAFNGSAAQGADDDARAVTAGTMHVGLIDGGYHAFAGRVASGVATIWADGANTTLDQAAVTGTYVNSSQHFAVGNLGNLTSTAFSANCTIVLVLAWNRALSDAEMASITANPFQVLQTLSSIASLMATLGITFKARSSATVALPLAAKTFAPLKARGTGVGLAYLTGATAARWKARTGIAGSVGLAAAAKSMARAASTFSGTITLAIQTQIFPQMRAGISASVAMLSLASNAVSQVKARAAFTGTTALSGRSTTSARSRTGFSAIAGLSSKVGVGLKAVSTFSGRTALAAAAKIAATVKMIPPGAIALVGSAFLKVAAFASPKGTATLTGRSQAQAKASGGSKASMLLSGATRLAGAAKSGLSAGIGLVSKSSLKSMARAASAGRAGLSGVAQLSSSARSSINTVVSLIALSGTVKAMSTARGNLIAKVALVANAEISTTGVGGIHGISPMIAIAGQTLIRSAARATLFVFGPSPRSTKAPFRSRSTKAPPNT